MYHNTRNNLGQFAKKQPRHNLRDAYGRFISRNQECTRKAKTGTKVMFNADSAVLNSTGDEINLTEQITFLASEVARLTRENSKLFDLIKTIGNIF